MLPSLLLLAFATKLLCQTISLPPLTGPRKVGTITLELIDTTRHSPDSSLRDLMVSIFYPIHHTRRYTLAPAYSIPYATYLEQALGLPTSLGSFIISQSYAGAYLHPTPNSREQPNVLLFSPGAGGSRVDYTATLENLASLGYIVIGVDHPFDTTFIDYPDGRIEFQIPEPLNETSAVKAVDIRVADLSFVLNILSANATLAKRIPGIHGKLDVKKVGIFGHSIGGAAAASAMLSDKRFACGANLDGSLWGPVVDKGLDQPFLLMSAEDHNRTSDSSWQQFWDHSKGAFKLEVGVNGARHGTFSDQAFLYGYLRKLGLIGDLGDSFGTIDGERILVVESAYLGAFFGLCFDGKKDELLKGESREFPEVKFWP